MNSIIKKLHSLSVIHLAVFIMVVTFIPRLINIYYNSAFNDEAIYIIVGLMGVFERDWWTYNADNWIPGVQFLYPSFTAIAYKIGGITASRLLNVILSVVLVEVIFVLTSYLYHKLTSKKAITKKTFLAGTIAALILGGSEISHYVSRLATYDMPAFTFLFLGLLLLVHPKPVTSGKRYFLASMAISFSYLIKIITGIYLPFIIGYFYFSAKKLGSTNLSFWKKYFLLPTFLMFLGFLSFSFSPLYQYYSTQQDLVKADLSQISQMLWSNSQYIWGFWLVGTVGMFLKKQFSAWATLTFAALWVVCFHLITSRTLSMDKHILIMLSFLSIVAGIGITNLLSFFKNKLLQVGALILIISALIFYWIIGFQKLETFNNQWQNLSSTERKMKEVVKEGDKVLVESGAAMILATYDQNYPPNTSTFDWLEYQNETGEKAFQKAVRDGYFNVIELESDTKPKSDTNYNISQIIKQNLAGSYRLTYSQDGFYIYERDY